MSTNPNSRSRRSSQEIRSLLLGAARELFLENGYERTTTIEISRRAGVDEKSLFSNFGSKAELFEAAILSSFEGFVDAYRAAWEEASAESTPEERMQLFVRGLFELAEGNRTILRSAIGGAQSGATGPQEQLLSRWAATLQSWEGIATTVRDELDLTIDPPASIAAVGAMVFGMALMDDLLFPAGAEAPSRERRIAAMEDLVLHGTLHKRGEEDG
jgi:AcrR family transcriptional regulator